MKTIICKSGQKGKSMLMLMDIVEMSLLVNGKADEKLKDNIKEQIKAHRKQEKKAAAYRKAAKGHAEEGKLEFDNGAVVSLSDGGAYVQSWLWISDEEI